MTQTKVTTNKEARKPESSKQQHRLAFSSYFVACVLIASGLLSGVTALPCMRVRLCFFYTCYLFALFFVCACARMLRFLLLLLVCVCLFFSFWFAPSSLRVLFG
jgi:hypothetical protein